MSISQLSHGPSERGMTGTSENLTGIPGKTFHIKVEVFRGQEILEIST
jgi:hypothetical protein